MRTSKEIDSILQEVQARLDAKRRATGVDLEVPKDGYVEDEPWLSVTVSPQSQGIRASQYVETLGEVEKELRRLNEEICSPYQA